MLKSTFYVIEANFNMITLYFSKFRMETKRIMVGLESLKKQTSTDLSAHSDMASTTHENVLDISFENS